MNEQCLEFIPIHERLLYEFLVYQYFSYENIKNGIWDKYRLNWFVNIVLEEAHKKNNDLTGLGKDYIFHFMIKNNMIKEEQVTVYRIDHQHKTVFEIDELKRRYYYEKRKYEKKEA